MKTSNFSSALLVAGTLLCVTSLGQSSQDSLVKKFERHRNASLQEKIYLHLDQTFHLTGELLWFKVYCVDGSFHRPLAMSSVAYIEILDAGNTAVVQTRVELKDGVGHGSLFLPATLTSGNYHVRAYTEWMKNSGVDFFFHQGITIVNPFVKLESSTTPVTARYDVQFFPEGGNWVSGLQSKTAFRATDESGKGIDFKGVILGEQGDTLALFKPLKFGIGHFSFTPQKDKNYNAFIIDRNGKRTAVKLPDIAANGYVMHLTDGENKIDLEVASSDLRSDYVYLFAHARQIKIKVEGQRLRDGKAIFSLKRTELPPGILHLTVLDESLSPLCERLYFNTPDQPMSAGAKPGQNEYGPRQKVKVDVTAPPGSNLSVSVFRQDSLSSLTPISIYETIWLTSDLKGTVESPGYYLTAADPTAREAVDNLMLTHGWRRFSWTNIVKPSSKVAFTPELHGPFLKGKVTDASGAPGKGITTFLAAPGKSIRFYGAASNEQGHFQFEVKEIRGKQKVVLQTDLSRDSTHRVEIISSFSDQYSARSLPPLTLSSTLEKPLRERTIAMQVHNSYFQSEINNVAVLATDSLPFYGKGDEIYFLDDYTRFPIMEEVMREYVPGVLVRKRKDKFYFLVLDNQNKSVFRENSMILLDGVPVFDVNKIMALDPLRIKKLDVIKQTYHLGALTLSGLVSYTSYEGDLGGLVLDPRVLTLDYEGLQQHREFYSPRYDTGKNDRIPDQRSLLHWQPLVTTDVNGKATVEFFSSDKKGEYKVEVQGMTRKGAFGSATSTFSVK